MDRKSCLYTVIYNVLAQLSAHTDWVSCMYFAGSSIYNSFIYGKSKSQALAQGLKETLGTFGLGIVDGDTCNFKKNLKPLCKRVICILYIKNIDMFWDKMRNIPNRNIFIYFKTYSLMWILIRNRKRGKKSLFFSAHEIRIRFLPSYANFCKDFCVWWLVGTVLIGTLRYRWCYWPDGTYTMSHCFSSSQFIKDVN